MRGLEDRIVADLVALTEEEEGCERGMLVFPTRLMAHLDDRALAKDARVVRRGDVALVCRKEG